MYILTRSYHRPERYTLFSDPPKHRPDEVLIAAFVADRSVLEMVYDPSRLKPFIIYREDGRVQHCTQPQLKGGPVKGGFSLTGRNKDTDRPTRGKGRFVDLAPDLSLYRLPHTFRPSPDRDGTFTLTHGDHGPATSVNTVKSTDLERRIHHPSYAAYSYAYRTTLLASELSRPTETHLSHFVVNADMSITLWYTNGEQRVMKEHRHIRRYFSTGECYANDRKRCATPAPSPDWE